MKTLYISLTLFILMIFSIAFSINYLNNIYNNFSKLNIEIESDLNSINWTKSEEDYNLFFSKWQETSKKISLFIDHKEMDNINTELWKQKQYINCKNKDEALASNNIIKFFLDHIRDLEKISLQNIF